MHRQNDGLEGGNATIVTMSNSVLRLLEVYVHNVGTVSNPSILKVAVHVELPSEHQKICSEQSSFGATGQAN